MNQPPGWRLRTATLPFEHTLLMGVVNVTPDSFSDDGLFQRPVQAVKQGMELAEAGAGIVDVGGESTRPGSLGVDVREELDRVIPVITGLVANGVNVSIDTSKAEVAAAALAAGAQAVNDTTALSDPAMASVIAEAGAGVVLMHMQGTPRTMQQQPHYEDVVNEVKTFLLERAALAEQAGIAADSIMIDPGIGFGKNLDQNLELLANLGILTATGYPVMLGTSRKSFLGKLTGIEEPTLRDLASAVTVALAVEQGISAVRVHNVAFCRQSALVAEAIVRAKVR